MKSFQTFREVINNLKWYLKPGFILDGPFMSFQTDSYYIILIDPNTRLNTKIEFINEDFLNGNTIIETTIDKILLNTGALTLQPRYIRNFHKLMSNILYNEFTPGELY